MKIAHLFQASSIQFAEPKAAQLHIYHTMRGLQQAGHDVTLLALQDGRRVLNTPDLTVFKSAAHPEGHWGKLGVSDSSPFKLFESGVRRIQRELKVPYFALFDSYRMFDACLHNLNGYDLIHERFNLLSIGGALASKKLGKPYFLEVNADLLAQRAFKRRPEKGARRLYSNWATRLVFDAADQIICISEDLSRHLHNVWNVPFERLAVLPCAADIERFGHTDQAARVRRELGLKSEPVVMWVGGFYPWHDVDLLVDSFCRIAKRFPQARLVLVGDGETRAGITRKIEAQGLQAAVVMTGSIPHKSVPDVLSIADVVVAPSPPVAVRNGGTGTPLKLFEYMAAGKAIVSTDVNQSTAVIQDGETGLLVEPGNVDALSRAVEHLLENPADSQRLGRNARQAAVEKHSWARYTQRLEEIYCSVP